MSDIALYIHGDLGNDQNDGLSESTPVRSPSGLALVVDTQVGLDNNITEIHWRGRLDVAHSGLGQLASIFFNPSFAFTDCVNYVYEGCYFCYGNVYDVTEMSPASSDTQFQIDLELPPGIDIEAVLIDWEQTEYHRHSDGRRYTDAEDVASIGAGASTAYSWYHNGTMLYVNIGDLPTTVKVIVLFRPVEAVEFHTVTANSWVYVNADDPGSWYVLMPRYIDTGLDHYFCRVNPSANTGCGPFKMVGSRADVSWHLYGVIGTTTTEVNDVIFTDNTIQPAAVVDIGAVAIVPFVVYSGITSGTLTINNYLGRRNRFRWFRPMRYDGTVIDEGTGGGDTSYNHKADVYFAHTGAGGKVEVFNDSPAVDLDVHECWDFTVGFLYFPMSTVQTLTADPFDVSAFPTYGRAVTFRNRLPYSADYNGLRYGLPSFATDCHWCLEKPVLKLPNCNVLVNSADTLLLFGETTGTNVRVELLEPKLMFAGNNVAEFRRAIGFVGSSGETLFRTRNPTFVSEATTLSESLVMFHCSGAGATFKIQCYNPIFHSNDAVNTTYFVMIYAATTSQIPLYSSDPSYLVFENGLYSNMGASRYDVSGGGQRDTATEWAANSGDGPHDGTLGNGAGRHALYASAGTWDSAAEQFGASDTARTATIDDSVTLTYAPEFGLNGRAFGRYRGADQYSVNHAARQLLLDVP